MISHFHSVVIDVADLDTGVSDYARLLGRAPQWVETDEVDATRSAHFPLANMRLEIRAGSAEAGDMRAGLSGMRLHCDDLAGALEVYASRGFPTERGIVEHASPSEGGSLRRWRSATIEPKASRSIPVELVSDEVLPEADRRSDDARVDPAGAVRALDHVVVFSADADTTRDFYGDGLGIRLALDRSFEKRGVRLLFFRVGGVTIEIGGRLGANPQPDSPDRFGGLAWQVSDIEAIQSRLLAERFDVSEIRDGNKPGTRVCTVRDPVHAVPTLLIEPVS